MAPIIQQPGECPLHCPAAREDLKPRAHFVHDRQHDLMGRLSRSTPTAAAARPDSRHRPRADAGVCAPWPNSSRSGSSPLQRSLALAEITTTARISPRVSTKRWRLRPLLFSLPSTPIAVPPKEELLV